MTIGKKMQSIKDLKKELATSSGNGTFIRYIKADEELEVRFLAEPEHWTSFNEHYVEGTGKKDPGRSFPCIGDGCPGCAIGNDSKQRYLAPAVDIERDRAVPLSMPKSLVTKLVSKYEKFGTILDRNYELSRTGAGLNTEYDLDAGYPQKMKLAKYQAPNLEDVLQSAFDDKFPDWGAKKAPSGKVRPRARSKAARELVDEPVKKTSDAGRKLKKTTVEEPAPKKPKKTAKESGNPYDKKVLAVQSLGQLRKLAKEENIKVTGLSKGELIEKLLNVPPF